MLPAGKLRHRVTIQRPVNEQDSSGDNVESWADVKSVWAAIEPMSAREFISSAAEQSKVTGRITIRYFADLTADMRIYHPAKGLYYDIQGILTDKDSGNEYITLPVSEGVRI